MAGIYLYIRNTFTPDVRRAKPKYFTSKVNEAKTLSAYWRLVKNATNLSKGLEPIQPLKREDGSLAVYNVEKAKIMSYVSSIGATLAAQLLVLETETGKVKDLTDIPTLAVIKIKESSVQNKY